MDTLPASSALERGDMDPGLAGDLGDSRGEPPERALNSDDRGDEVIATRQRGTQRTSGNGKPAPECRKQCKDVEVVGIYRR